MQFQEAMQRPLNVLPVPRDHEFEPVAIALERVVTVPQGFADVALESRAEFLPARRQIQNVILADFVPPRSGFASQCLGHWLAETAPVNPVPVSDLAQALLDRAHGQPLIAGRHQRLADFGQRRIRADRSERGYPERPETPPGEDQRDERNTGAAGAAQDAEPRRVLQWRAAIEKVLAPGQMPFLHCKGQRVAGDLIEMFIVALEGTNTRDRGDDLGRELERRRFDAVVLTD